MDLTNQTILITGAARRVGKVMALAVAKAGGSVIIHHSSSPDAALETKKEIAALGSEAHILQADFSNPSSSIQLLKDAFTFGPLDGLVNSASIFMPLSWDETTLDQWNLHLAINLTAPFLLSQSFAAYVPENKQARIVNILDWRALRPGSDHFPYTISKTALWGLTKSMAVSLAPRVTVNGIAFGAILPPSDGTGSDDVLQDVPLKRWADLSEVEESLLFLLTGPRYITGEIIHLDGGRHLI